MSFPLINLKKNEKKNRCERVWPPLTNFLVPSMFKQVGPFAVHTLKEQFRQKQKQTVLVCVRLKKDWTLQITCTCSIIIKQWSFIIEKVKTYI